MRILHVTECFAGGVTTAIVGYAANLHDHEHFLLANARRSVGGKSTSPKGLFLEEIELPERHVEAVRQIARIAEEIQPDVIHAHSSFAGLYVRLAKLIPAMHEIPVVYTPHGLAFVRKDVSKFKKAAFVGMEKALVPMTTVFAGCSTNESDLLRSLAPRAKHVCVPNAVSDLRIEAFPRWKRPVDPVIGILGRITAARNPELMVEIAEKMKDDPDLSNVRVRWIGDGEEVFREKLVHSGVEVTGWVESAEVPRALCELSVLVHTAKWDGFPMAVLEAQAMGVPTIVSDIPALAECPKGARFKSADEAIREIRELISNPSGNDWSKVNLFYNQAQQRRSLLEAYEAAIEKESSLHPVELGPDAE